MTADTFNGPFPVSFMEVVDLAVGLGGWRVDPNDPFKAPYPAASAALGAMRHLGWPEEDPLYDKLVESLTETVQEAHDEDAGAWTDEELEDLRRKWTEAKLRERGEAEV